MPKKPNITTVASGFNSTTTINASLEALRDSFDNTLSLDGSTPNAMLADLDLNGNKILNADSVDVAKLTLNGQQITDLSSVPEWRSSWSTGVAYSKNDLVQESGNSYICLVDHTSGTFSTDLVALRWELFAAKGAAGVGTGDMIGANNLSDVTDVDAARANINAQVARTITGTTDQIAVTNGDGVSGNPTIAAVVASQAEAQAGTDNTKLMTPLRTAEAVAALASSLSGFRQRIFYASTTYTPPVDVKEIYVMVFGSTGGSNGASQNGGVGGAGYAEKKYTAPFTGAPFTITIGAGGQGSSAGASGGTTSFATVSITGSGGVDSVVTGGAGGVASGGDFNANGGAGGTGRATSTVANGGGGGAATRAGNGGNGGNAASGIGGAGGGTGGNNASGATPGIAATSVAVGAVSLPEEFFGPRANAIFRAGGARSSVLGGTGASGLVGTQLLFPVEFYVNAAFLNAAGGNPGNSADNGIAGTVVVLEVI